MKEWLLNPWVASVGSGVVVAIIVATLTGLRKTLARFFRETIPHLWGVFRIQIRKRFARHRKPMILITCFAKEGTEKFPEARAELERAAELFEKEGRSEDAEKARELLEGLPG